jgi:hypothetical protein
MRIVPVVTLVVLATLVSASAAGADVRLATQDSDRPLQVRPALVSYTGDGTGYLAGRSSYPRQLHKGGLHWVEWKQRVGFAHGYAWINNCHPSCANGHFSRHRATVRVRRPRHGLFTLMTIRYRYGQRRIIDHRKLVYIPPSSYEGEHFPGYYVWGLCGGNFGKC